VTGRLEHTVWQAVNGRSGGQLNRPQYPSDVIALVVLCVSGGGPERTWRDGAHRTNVYLNNRLEQDHRGIKDRYGPMEGFKSIPSARLFCCAFDEVRGSLRERTVRRQQVLADRRRLHHLHRITTVLAILEAA
jgi:hypothetical protein